MSMFRSHRDDLQRMLVAIVWLWCLLLLPYRYSWEEGQTRTCACKPFSVAAYCTQLCVGMTCENKVTIGRGRSEWLPVCCSAPHSHSISVSCFKFTFRHKSFRICYENHRHFSSVIYRFSVNGPVSLECNLFLGLTWHTGKAKNH